MREEGQEKNNNIEKMRKKRKRGKAKEKKE